MAVASDKLLHSCGSAALVLLAYAFFQGLSCWHRATWFGSNNDHCRRRRHVVAVVYSALFSAGVGLVKELTDLLLPRLPWCPCHADRWDILANWIGIVGACVLLLALPEARFGCSYRNRGDATQSSGLHEIRAAETPPTTTVGPTQNETNDIESVGQFPDTKPNA